MDLLDDDALYHIGSYLDTGDIFNLEKVDRRWRALIHSNREHFPRAPIVKKVTLVSTAYSFHLTRFRLTPLLDVTPLE